MESSDLDAFLLFASFVIGSNFLALLMRTRQTLQTKCLAYVGRVRHLVVYPVKSCTGIETEKALFSVTGMGLPYWHMIKDRHFVVVFENENDPSCHRVLTQRQCPRLALIKLAVIEGPPNDDGRVALTEDETKELTLRLSAPDMPNFDITLPVVHQAISGSNRIIKANLFDETIFGYDCGPNAAAWLRIFIGRDDVSLMHSSCESHLKSLVALPRWPHSVAERIYDNDKTAYADWAPTLLIGSASVDELNGRIRSAANGNGEEFTPVSYKNFRPNVLVETKVPFDEDSYDRIYIAPASLVPVANGNGDSKTYWLNNEQSQLVADEAPVILRNVKPCGRCVLATVDPVLGERRSDGQPLKMLRSYRIDSYYSNAPLFGIYLAIERAGHLKSGDAVFVSFMANSNKDDQQSS